jgi:acyl carrier protein
MSIQMHETQIRDRVRGFLQENFFYMRPDFQLSDDDGLLERGVVDSMGVAEMVTFIEDEFEIKVSDEDITEANLGTLRAIGRFVSNKRATIAA